MKILSTWNKELLYFICKIDTKRIFLHIYSLYIQQLQNFYFFCCSAFILYFSFDTSSSLLSTIFRNPSVTFAKAPSPPIAGCKTALEIFLIPPLLMALTDLENPETRLLAAL